jgi:hypothetical protein
MVEPLTMVQAAALGVCKRTLTTILSTQPEPGA